jgi:hypothetical protein
VAATGRASSRMAMSPIRRFMGSSNGSGSAGAGDGSRISTLGFASGYVFSCSEADFLRWVNRFVPTCPGSVRVLLGR